MANEWMLSARNQRILKAIHVICVACVLGGAVALLALMLLKGEGKVEDPFLIDWSVYMLFNTVVYYAFFGVLLTAFIYAMFTKWGFFKHHWITVKWLGILIIFALVWFWVGPAINGTASLSDGGFHLTNPEEYMKFSADSRFFLMLEGGIVLFLCLISFLKPWGTRKKEYNINRKLIVIVVALLVIGGTVNAIMGSLRLQKYRQMKIAHADVANLADGIYRGEAEVGSYTYTAEVTVQDHRITDVKFHDQRDSPYVRYAEGVAPKILAAQSPNVDTVTGATTTSKALMKAVEQALTNPIQITKIIR